MNDVYNFKDNSMENLINFFFLTVCPICMDVLFLKFKKR